MLHRPADSRLLSNLLSHEKEYARALHSQFDYGQSSLSSFSAYAAASPPTISRAIGSVATALAGAQDALRGYVLAVEEWCGQLKMLKDLENEVGTIARDREILVDRLVKASKTKTNNPKRRSILPSSSSNHQGSSVFSTSHSSLEHLQASFSNSKLELAQNELQACETHLTEKERLLAQMRESAVVGGLKIRCKALVECGWKWTEVGKAGLMALDCSPSMGPMDHQHGLFEKPLPDVNYPYQPAPSDLSSSLGPSQSASQIFHGDAVSEQHVPSPSNSSSPGLRGHAPNSETHASSQYTLDLPPAHAISEEDHYIPPRARVQESVEDEAGGSSLEDETEDRQYEVHDNPLFSHPLSAKLNSKKAGSKTGLHLKRSNRQDSKSAAIVPSSVSAPLPTTQTTKEHAQRHNNDHYGTSSSANTYSDGHQESSRNRKRSTFLGISALSGIFHKRERSTSMSAESSNDPFSIRSPPSPKKGGFWHTRIDKNIKKSGKDDDSSDDDGERKPVRTSPIPSYLTHVAGPKTSPESHPRTTEKEGISARPKRIPSNGRKLRKVSDGDAHRKASGSEVTQTPRPVSERRDSAAKTAKEKEGRSESRGNGNGYISPLSSPSVSRSSTMRSASTVKTSPPARPASVDLASSNPRGRRTALSDAGHTGRGKGHRRTTSLSHVSTPPTHGQTSLLSIVEDVTRQNRQGWLHTNPNSLLIEIKAPRSVYQAAEEPVLSANNQQTNSDTTFDYAARRESPLRHELGNGLRGNSIPASSSEPSLPFKLLPPTPSPLPRAPLRSALRNRSASPNPATLSPPRTASPMRSTASSLSGGGTAPAGSSNELKGTTLSPLKDNDSESLSSVYETGQEDFDSDPPTPRGREEDHVLPNGNALQNTANGSQISEDASSTGGTATPPSRRKSVRVSLKPTFSPTPPALADYEEDHSPWASGPSSPPDEQVRSGWISRKVENDGWEDSSDEDEEYSQARKMLLKASRKLEKVSRGG